MLLAQEAIWDYQESDPTSIGEGCLAGRFGPGSLNDAAVYIKHHWASVEGPMTFAFA